MMEIERLLYICHFVGDCTEMEDDAALLYYQTHMTTMGDEIL